MLVDVARVVGSKGSGEQVQESKSGGAGVGGGGLDAVTRSLSLCMVVETAVIRWVSVCIVVDLARLNGQTHPAGKPVTLLCAMLQHQPPKCVLTPMCVLTRQQDGKKSVRAALAGLLRLIPPAGTYATVERLTQGAK
jgi:hypothetical protein